MATAIELKQKLLYNFSQAYPHITDSEIAEIYDTAFYVYSKLLSPLVPISTVSEDRLQDFEWIKQAMREIIERSGVTSAVAYSENGMSINFDDSLISKGLKSLIIPKARI